MGETGGYAQYFLAGQHDASNYYFNIDPDTTLTGPYNHGGNLPPAVFTVDMNGDGVADFYFKSVGFWANGGGYASVTIVGCDTNDQVAFGHNDTCQGKNPLYNISKIARLFRKDDTLNTSQIWEKSLVLTYNDWALSLYSCSLNSFTTDTIGSYIGVRIIEPADTLFGRIKVANVHELTFTVQEFGSNKNITGMKELPGKMRIYPNPSFGKVLLESPVPEFDLVVYNNTPP